MKFRDVFWKILAALPSVIFWFWYFQPLRIDGSENWLRFAVLLFTTALCAILLIVSMIVAVRATKDIGWWLITILNLAVVVMFFVN